MYTVSEKWLTTSMYTYVRMAVVWATACICFHSCHRLHIPSSCLPHYVLNSLLQEALTAGLVAFEQDSIASFTAAKEARFAEKHGKVPQIRQRYEDVMKK